MGLPRAIERRLTGWRDAVRLGRALPLYPDTASGWCVWERGGRESLGSVSTAGLNPTNIVPDPRCTASTFWPSSTGNTEVTAGSAVADTGRPLPPRIAPYVSTCLKLANNGTADQLDTQTMAILGGGTHAVGLCVYPKTVGGTLTISVQRTGDSSSFTLATITGASDGWSYVTARNTVTVGQSPLALRFAFGGGLASEVYVTAAVVFNTSSGTTPFFCGGMPQTAWSGTADASTSVAQRSCVRYSGRPYGVALTGARGTLGVMLFLASDTFGAPELSYIRNSANDNYSSRITLFSNKFGYQVRDGSAATLIQGSAVTPTSGSFYRVIGRHDGTSLFLNHDGTDVTPVSSTRVLDPGASNGWRIAESNDYSQPGNPVGLSFASPRCFPDAVVAAMQANGGALWAQPLRLLGLWRRYGCLPVAVVPNDGNVTGLLVVR